MTPYGYYNGWCFPKNIDYYSATIPIETVDKKIQENWLSTYDYFSKKLTLYHKGKQLVLKNPANTARIKLLLSRYPQANLVHISRNPYDVFSSMQKFISIVLPRYCIQTPPSQQRLQQVIFNVYHDRNTSYLQQKKPSR